MAQANRDGFLQLLSQIDEMLRTTNAAMTDTPSEQSLQPMQLPPMPVTASGPIQVPVTASSNDSAVSFLPLSGQYQPMMNTQASSLPDSQARMHMGMQQGYMQAQTQ